MIALILSFKWLFSNLDTTRKIIKEIRFCRKYQHSKESPNWNVIEILWNKNVRKVPNKWREIKMELNVQVEIFVFLLQNYQFSGINSSIQFFGEISLELLTVFQSLRRKATFIFFFNFYKNLFKGYSLKLFGHHLSWSTLF